MRRTTAILVGVLCAVSGCRGSAAQEPSDAVVTAAGRPAEPGSVPAPAAAEGQPMASEVDVRWAIALISDRRVPVAKRPARVVVVDRTPDVDGAAPAGGDFQVAADNHVHEKPVTPKTCSGVVKTRS